MTLRGRIYRGTLQIICIMVLLGLFLYLLLRWSSFPDKLPAHWNAAGEIDRWGGKGEIHLMPVIMFIMYVGMSIIERFPKSWNIGVAVTPGNSARVYETVFNMLVTLKTVLVTLISGMVVLQSLARPLPAWGLPVFLVLVFAPIVFSMVRLYIVR